MLVTISPARAGIRKSLFSFSLPKFAKAGVNLEKVYQVIDISSGSHPYCHSNSCTVAMAKGLKKSAVVFVVQALAAILLIPEM